MIGDVLTIIGDTLIVLAISVLVVVGCLHVDPKACIAAAPALPPCSCFPVPLQADAGPDGCGCEYAQPPDYTLVRAP